MNVTVSKHSGFCFGVQRAVDLALNEAQLSGSVFTLGPIIHNSFVVNDLASKGVTAVDSVSQAEGAVLVIRSHGVGRKVYEEAEAKCSKLVDATCPFVKKIHELVREYSSKGYTIVIAGKKDHPEVIGIMGWSDSNTFVVDCAEDIDLIPLDENKKICLVAQTTIDMKHFETLRSEIVSRFPEALIFNTICSATAKRQQAAEELSKNVDVMYVIGDEKSSNTKRLYELCKKHCNNTFAVQSAADVMNIYGNARIGIVAGASTPDWVIREVISKMTEEQIVTSEEVVEEAKMEDFEKSMVKLHKGSVVNGTVIYATDDAVYVNLGYKADGVIPKSEYKLEEGQTLSDVAAKGDVVEVEVAELNDGDGNVILSRKPTVEKAAWVNVLAVKENDEIVTVKVTEAVKGGALATYETFRVFIPASHLAVHFVKNVETFVGKELKVKFIDVDPAAKRIVASRKIVAQEERAKKEEAFWESHKVGDIVKGKVKNIAAFGAFVDLGLFDGLIHISELSWDSSKPVAETVSVGEEVEAKIVAIDRENNKISLNRRALLPHPWESVSEKYAEGDVVKVRVTTILDFGAIVAIEPHINGVLHISQISRKRVEKVADVLNVGDEFEVKIMAIEPEKRRISVSKKALEPKPEKAADGERKPRADKASGDAPKKRRAPKAEKQEASPYTKEDMTINLGDFFPQEMLDEIREAEKN